VSRRPTRGRRRAGFTLLELMVALAILAIALPAVMRAVGAATRQLDEVRLRTLAGWVADNRLAEHRARRDWLPLGRQEGRSEQGGQSFGWAEEVLATPNAQFRRVEVSVWLLAAGSDAPGPVLGRLNGFVTQ
jgi:general secretion pathway protein I